MVLLSCQLHLSVLSLSCFASLLSRRDALPARRARSGLSRFFLSTPLSNRVHLLARKHFANSAGVAIALPFSRVLRGGSLAVLSFSLLLPFSSCSFLCAWHAVLSAFFCPGFGLVPLVFDVPFPASLFPLQPPFQPFGGGNPQRRLTCLLSRQPQLPSAFPPVSPSTCVPRFRPRSDHVLRWFFVFRDSCLSISVPSASVFGLFPFSSSGRVGLVPRRGW